MDDSVQIKCNRCKTVFRDRARRLQNGYSRQCPSCEVLLFFDEDSQQPNIKSAMRQARLLRKQLRELEAAGAFTRTSSPSKSRRYAGRGRSDARTEDSRTER
jgi:predicted  nucleic acid-binding Zn-ribbon protein